MRIAMVAAFAMAAALAGACSRSRRGAGPSGIDESRAFVEKIADDAVRLWATDYASEKRVSKR